ncbi:hypothetical protein JCM10213_003979 [Rhodosporidiobolus nylandii]
MAQPSSAQPGRIEVDDGGREGGAGGRRTAEEASRTPPSLLDLPDELLEKVFRLLYASLLPEDLSDTPNGLAVPVSHILVTKRIHRVALPIWLSAMCGGTESSLAALLANLSEDRAKAVHVRQLKVCLPKVSSLTSHAISTLSNLSSLSISFTDNNYLPPSFVRMLRCLVNLRHLDIADYPAGPLDLDIARDVPSLRVLSVLGLDISSQVFKGRLDSLSHLILRTTMPDGLDRVWPSVPHLTLAPEDGDYDDAGDFLSLLEHATTSDPSPFLRTRRVSFKARTTRLVSNDTRLFTCTHLHASLELLRSSPVEHLDLFFVDSLDWAVYPAAFPSLRFLTLDGSCKLYEEANLTYLPSLFTLFPSLESLHLRGFAFSPTAGESASLSLTPPHAVPFALRFPFLAAMLSYLASMGLLNFRCRTGDGRRELRWTRPKREEDFECEGWTLE